MQLSAEKPVLDTGICEIDILLTMVIVSPCSCMSAWRTLRTESSAGSDLNRFRGRDWVYGGDLYVFDGYAFFPGHLNFFVNHGKMNFRHGKNSLCINPLRTGLMVSGLPELHRDDFQRLLYQRSLRVRLCSNSPCTLTVHGTDEVCTVLDSVSRLTLWKVLSIIFTLCSSTRCTTNTLHECCSRDL